MAVTDPQAIRYCNEQIRPAADRLARCYYRAKKIQDRWQAISGDSGVKFGILKQSIIQAAGLFDNTWFFCFKADRLWNSGSMVALFPNDSGELIYDNSSNTGQDQVRPPMTSQDVRRVKNRMEEFVNHLARGTGADKHWLTDSNATLPITYDFYDTIGRLARGSAKDPTSSWGAVFVNQRCADIVAQYESAPAVLNQVLVAAVNPNDNVEV